MMMYRRRESEEAKLTSIGRVNWIYSMLLPFVSIHRDRKSRLLGASPFKGGRIHLQEEGNALCGREVRETLYVSKMDL